MSQPLSIRDLLANGAKPTAEDAANLKRIATFVSRHFAQVGARQSPKNRENCDHNQ